MPTRITLAEHLSVEELEQSYRRAKDGIESRQFHVLWLLAQGKKTSDVSSIAGYSRNWIYRIVKRYNSCGVQAVRDRRQDNYGTNSILDDAEQAELWQVLQEAAPDGGLWNGRKVADWLSARKGEPVHRQRGWEILKQMTFRLRVPRPQHTKANPEEQDVWKKTN